MDPLVPDVAVSVIPEPVPVVMETVLRELVFRRRTEPEVVVHALRNGLDRLPADRVAPLETQSAGHIDIANQTVAHMLDRFTCDARPAVGSMLHQPVVLLRGRRHLF